MIKIKLIHGSHTVLSTGKTYSAGDVIDGTEQMLKGLAGKAERYDIQANNVGLDDDALKAELRKDLDELGIEFDGRWGVERLQSELEKALADGNTEA